MTADRLSTFSQVWLVDFEFHQPDGECPMPLCMVTREWRTGHTLRLWRDELVGRNVAPIPVAADVLVVAYYATRRTGQLLGAGLAAPRPHPRLVRRVPVPHVRVADGVRPRPLGCSRPLRS